MDPLADNFARVEARIAAACAAAGRPRSSVKLIAVSKNFDADAVRRAADLGQLEFGENRLQEAEPKIAALAGRGLRWNFVGRIQTNKLKGILENFAMVQSLDRVEVLDRAERFLTGRSLSRDGLIEVCVSDEGTKAGFGPEAVSALIRSGGLERYQALRIRGLMTIAPHTPDQDRIRESFERVRGLFEEGCRMGYGWDTLSMGMSADLEEAIGAGSTMVRVGTAIFGKRD